MLCVLSVSLRHSFFFSFVDITSLSLSLSAYRAQHHASPYRTAPALLPRAMSFVKLCISGFHHSVFFSMDNCISSELED